MTRELKRAPRRGLAVHGILESAIQSMFQKKGHASGSVKHLVNSIVSELIGNDVVQATPDEAAASPYVCPDVPVSKVQGVRATKSAAWIGREETLVELLALVVTSEPIANLSAWLFRTQRLQSWLHRDAAQRPLVCLATKRFSPAVTAVNECVLALTSNPDELLSILDGALDCLV